jgi:hypothetical protein
MRIVSVLHVISMRSPLDRASRMINKFDTNSLLLHSFILTMSLKYIREVLVDVQVFEVVLYVKKRSFSGDLRQVSYLGPWQTCNASRYKPTEAPKLRNSTSLILDRPHRTSHQIAATTVQALSKSRIRRLQAVL